MDEPVVRVLVSMCVLVSLPRTLEAVPSDASACGTTPAPGARGDRLRLPVRRGLVLVGVLGVLPVARRWDRGLVEVEVVVGVPRRRVVVRGLAGRRPRGLLLRGRVRMTPARTDSAVVLAAAAVVAVADVLAARPPSREAGVAGVGAPYPYPWVDRGTDDGGAM